MQLTTHLQHLVDILEAQPPEGATLGERGKFYKGQTALAKAYAASMGHENRQTALGQLIAYRKAIRPGGKRLEVLCNIEGLFEMDYPVAQPEEVALTRTRRIDYSVFEGGGVAPTMLLRTGVFADASTDENARVLKALGFKNATIERWGKVLNQDHLFTLAYTVALVREWDDNGTTVRFNAWEAVRAFGWAVNTASVRRLKSALEDLQMTRIRVVYNADTEREGTAPIVGRCLTEMTERSRWEVQLNSVLLDMLLDYRTFLSFNTLAALPQGTATWLYAFIATHEGTTTWDLDELAAAAGLTSANPYEVKRKLKAALDILVDGVVEVKARGKATHQDGKGELVEENGRLVVRSTTTTTKTFTPPIKAYNFTKTAKGKPRVELIR